MTTPQSGQVLSHYRLVEKIGEGGMGVVWKAEDTLLGRVVAIKVLPAGVDRDEGRRQLFLQEARLASSMSAAHIVQVYDFGREQDIDFIVMEHVEGKPLSRILHGRPLPPEKVAALGQQMAQALSRAHRKGLLHRDLKPSNMLVTTDGDVKVVDFGLAVLFENRDRSLLSEALSQAPTAAMDKAAGLVGTLPYMSPEQARGEKLDPRTDIFSLGVVLYEMTTGQRPFSGTTNAEVLREILKARPRPPHEISARVPLDLERIIAKALAPARTDRYQTMDDLAVDLKRLNRELESGSSPSFDDISDPSKLRGWRRAWMWAVVGVLVAGPVAYGAWRLHVGSRTGADSRTILILPLHVAGQTEESAYPERAFAEAIAVNLAQSKNLTVLPVAGDSDLGRAGPLQRAAAAARLGAGRLLTASLTRQGGSIHASLNLVDTGRNRILWGAQQEGDNGSLSRLAASVSAALASELGAVPRRRYEYPLNMTGSPAMASSPDTAEAVGALRRYQNERALDLTERLVKEFPREPDALALRAYALFHASTASGVSFVYSQAGRNLLEQSLAALEHVDPGNAVGATIRCELLGGEVGRSEDRVTCANQLLSRDDLTPAARAWALRNRSVAKDSVGDTGAALEDIKEASLLDPTNHFSIEGIGLYREKMDDLPGAANAYRQCNALAPEFSQCYWLLYRVLQRVGKWQEAEAPAAKGCELERTRGFCAPYAYSLVKNGHRPEALEAAADAATLPSDDGGAFELARTQAVLGDRREALRFLRLAVKPGSTDLDMIKEAPYLFKEADFGSFQNDPEFRAVFADIRKFLSSSGSAGDRP